MVQNMQQVEFQIVKILDSRKSGSIIEVGAIYTGDLDPTGRCIWFSEPNGQEWVFYIGESCTIVNPSTNTERANDN